MSREASRWTIVRAYFHERCQKCGKEAPLKNPQNSGWLLHHIDKNEQNNNPQNLTLLCKSCHAIVHKDDLPHPRKSNRPFVVCPVCGKQGVITLCGFTARIYHCKVARKDNYCNISKISHMDFLREHLTEAELMKIHVKAF